jgi:hypothetical protein
MGLSNASASNRAIILAALAIVSAILSNYFAWNHHKLWALQLVFLNTPLLPGIFFGTVLSLAIWLWVSRHPFKLGYVLLATAVAWVGANITANYVFGSIQQMLVEIAPGGTTSPTINFMFAVSGVLGGLVGSATLTFGLSLVCKEFGAFENWARVVMPGTALGVLLELGAKDDKLPVHIGSTLPLFLAWQVTIAAVIGYCIVPRTGDCKPVSQYGPELSPRGRQGRQYQHRRPLGR